ncbi:unnamed protein product [Meloidogyne enterolobii]|uniref:Uncharacterized protein n=1 Tax=Meloidogyne enterolobii TaxID=390850 RepID=A0ACB0XYS5_MELEN
MGGTQTALGGFGTQTALGGAPPAGTATALVGGGGGTQTAMGGGYGGTATCLGNAPAAGKKYYLCHFSH